MQEVKDADRFDWVQLAKTVYQARISSPCLKEQPQAQNPVFSEEPRAP
jgi:hypothetical protein